jgi:hypothetical protein
MPTIIKIASIENDIIYPVRPSISVEASVKTTEATRLMITILISHLIFVFFFILYKCNSCFDEAAADEVNLTA